ncbi:MAG: VanZ family protein [Cytophagaceae bacterium]
MILRYNLFTIAWAVLILAVTLTPGASMPDLSIWDLLSFDRFAHLFVFSVLVFLMTIGFTKQYTSLFLRFNAARLAFLFSFGYSLVLELLQEIIPGRSVEINDVIANSTGCLLGSLVFYLIYKY